jgi:RNA-directed DNA polymerase
LGNLATPKSVQKLQTALHAKAKAAPGYRFYARYDKIGREDILAHAYACCRSNQGAPGVDGQEFADIEAYGVQRWLGELALALREEGYRPEPIERSVHSEDQRQTQAAGHLDPARSGVHDSSNAGARTDL